jgi:hypothetical protein
MDYLIFEKRFDYFIVIKEYDKYSKYYLYTIIDMYDCS